MHGIEAADLIDLNALTVFFLVGMGFVGGLVSGFIGSGGAFVLTPGMMSLGVPGLVAVASNMCHKFPKALVGAIKRAQFGQVDLKLGLIMGCWAQVGVLCGAQIQERIKEAYGNDGSSLYVSLVFVFVLATVGGFVLRDGLKMRKEGEHDGLERTSRLALWVQSIRIPGTMVHLKSIDGEVSALFTIPLPSGASMPLQESGPNRPHPGMLRYPDVSASHIVFMYANDLWLVPRAGGAATLLVNPPWQEIFPRFSPD